MVSLKSHFREGFQITIIKYYFFMASEIYPFIQCFLTELRKLHSRRHTQNILAGDCRDRPYDHHTRCFRCKKLVLDRIESFSGIKPHSRHHIYAHRYEKCTRGCLDHYCYNTTVVLLLLLLLIPGTTTINPSVGTPGAATAVLTLVQYY